jgi:hypothetical protein
MRVARLTLAVLPGLLLTLAAGAPAAEGGGTIVPERHAEQVVAVRDVRVRDGGVVSGLIVNDAATPLRDIKLLIRYQWVWQDERHPGSNNPGRVAYHTVYNEIPPEVSVNFTYRPDPPLPDRQDGHFETSVEVVGWVEVGR